MNYNGHLDLGVKSSEEEDTAIPRAINLTKISIIPVQKNYFGWKIDKPHTSLWKMRDHCGTVMVWVVAAPRGTGILPDPENMKLLLMVSIDYCCMSDKVCTETQGNFVKATFEDISKTYR